MNNDKLLAELISAVQYLDILLLRTDPDKYPPIHPRPITNKEVTEIISGLVPRWSDLDEDIYQLVIQIRKEKYNIQ